MQKNNKQLLIFDLDGTLIDSVPDLAYATNATLMQLNQPTFAEDIIRHWVGNGAKKLIERALSGSADVSSYLTDEFVQQALELFFTNYEKYTCVKTQTYIGVDEGLHLLKDSGFILALVTNKPSQFIPTIIEKMRWQNLFSLLLGGDSLAQKKPHPAPLQYVCRELDIPVKASYMIGDSKNDVLAGKNAGMDTLALSYGYNYGQDICLENPTQTFDNFHDLVKFILS